MDDKRARLYREIRTASDRQNQAERRLLRATTDKQRQAHAADAEAERLVIDSYLEQLNALPADAEAANHH